MIVDRTGGRALGEGPFSPALVRDPSGSPPAYASPRSLSVAERTRALVDTRQNKKGT